MGHFLETIVNIIDWISIGALILFFAGLIMPRLVLPFIKVKTRGRSSLIYGLIVLSCIVAELFLRPHLNINNTETTKTTIPKIEDIVTPIPKCMQPFDGPNQRSTEDLPDDVQGKQFHVIYVLPEGGEDRNMDTNGQLATSISAFQNWLCNQTNGKYFHFDTYQGKLDISFAKLPLTTKEMWDGVGLPSPKTHTHNPVLSELGVRLSLLGFNDPDKIYVVYYEGYGEENVCGEARPNTNMAVEFLQPLAEGYGCGFLNWEQGDTYRPMFNDFTMVHEMLHTLGFVPQCSPHCKNFHCQDSKTDLMAGIFDSTGDGKYSWGMGTYPFLDYNHNDYYGANIKGCPDLKSSPYWTSKGS